MYIQYKNKNYHCRCIVGNKAIHYKGLPDNFSEAAEGEIVLCADDGFKLRTDNVENYLRQTFENGTLTLTNMPKKEVVEETKTETEPTEIEKLRADIDFLALMTGVEL